MIYLVVEPSVLVSALGLVLLDGLVLFEIQLEQSREGNGGQHADAGRERQHQPDHDAGEVDGAHGVQDDEHALVVDVLDAEP